MPEGRKIRIGCFIIGVIMATTLSSCTQIPADQLPGYVTVDVSKNIYPEVLTTPAKEVTFPLASEDLRDIQILEEKFNAEENCAGLAAPQIGIGKKIIIFAVPDGPDLRKWRPDLTQTMDKTLWINPSYEGIGDEKQEDYEACFSVPAMAGLVSRYKRIRYRAYTIDGKLVEGEAEGFLARAIQHETDHVWGKLYTHYVKDGKLINIEEYRKMRAEAIKTGKPVE
jgi:peptide deformylase